MPWCPRCGAEYRNGHDKCQDCGIRLVATKPEVLEQSSAETTRFWSRERVMRIVRALIMVFLALAAGLLFAANGLG